MVKKRKKTPNATSRGKTSFVVLGLLTIEPMSGYAICEMIKNYIGHFWSESFGQIYPTLEKLLRQNLITIKKSSVGKRPKNIYSITNEGIKYLQQWLSETGVEKHSHRDEELLKLFFGKNSTFSKLSQLIKTRKKRCKQTFTCYKIILKTIEKHKQSKHYLFWLMTLQNGMAHAKAEINWCHSILRTIAKLNGTNH